MVPGWVLEIVGKVFRGKEVVGDFVNWRVHSSKSGRIGNVGAKLKGEEKR